jgi:hypothetical protein
MQIVKPLYAAVLVCSVSFFSACSKQVETKDIYSPDKTIILRIETNEGGGAAVPDVTSVYLLAANASIAGKSLIFKGSAMSDFSAEWDGQGTIKLSFTNGYVTECDRSPALSTGEKMTVQGCK